MHYAFAVLKLDPIRGLTLVALHTFFGPAMIDLPVLLSELLGCHSSSASLSAAAVIDCTTNMAGSAVRVLQRTCVRSDDAAIDGMKSYRRLRYAKTTGGV